MNYIEGVDVSKWQGLMSWQKTYRAGARFAFIRAGSISNKEGICYVDHQFERNSVLAPPIMPVGYYFYMRPNHDAYKQADYFWGLIEDKQQQLPPVIDIEDPGGEPQQYVQKRLKQFVERLSALSNDSPIIYTSPGFANPFLGDPGWLGDIPLWVANWRTGPPVLPIAWDTWDFHQWSADGNRKGHEYGAAGSHDIDLNRFNGDAEDFAAYIGGEIPEPPPTPEPSDIPEPPETPESYVAQVDPDKCTFLNVRSEGVYKENLANVMGNLRAGRLVQVLDDSERFYKILVPEHVGYAHMGFLKKV